MKSKGYWLSPTGQLLDVTRSSHVRAIIDVPEAFNLSAEAVRDAYAHFNEPLGLEGKARTALINRALESGFIRLRHYARGGPVNGWSITCSSLNEPTRSLIAGWATSESDRHSHAGDVQVLVAELSTSQRTPISLADCVSLGEAATVHEVEAFKSD
ncbi:MAG: hypothetical protein P1U64_11810 [Alcanivoracaceae bacterium]|nr:hypothetical protein [Alcanivoracaceae bacterium]